MLKTFCTNTCHCYFVYLTTCLGDFQGAADCDRRGSESSSCCWRWKEGKGALNFIYESRSWSNMFVYTAIWDSFKVYAVYSHIHMYLHMYVYVCLQTYVIVCATMHLCRCVIVYKECVCVCVCACICTYVIVYAINCICNYACI